jgi:hypothetical protein
MQAVKELEIGLKKLTNTSYDSIDHLMRVIMKKYNMTAKELHNNFVKKHNKTPDTWIKAMKESVENSKMGLEGKRYCNLCRKSETQQECKFGPEMWKKFSIATVHPANMPEEKDHEYSMARSELKTAISAIKRLQQKMKGEGNIEAWIQSKITKASDYLDTAADYLDSGESKVNEDSINEKRGLWDNINARKKAGKPPKKPGEKGYPKTLDIDEEHMEEGMTLKDFKVQRSKVNRSQKRAAEKIAPGRRSGIHKPSASPERAARHRANVDPDFEGNDERNYPGGKLRSKKVRKAKALGELGEQISEDLKQARQNVGASKCWTGKKVGKPPTKMKGGKEVPNCVAAEDASLTFSEFMQLAEDAKMGRQTDDQLSAAHKQFSSMDQSSPANQFMLKRIQKEINRRKKSVSESAAWQRKEGKNPEGGLNKKGIASYRKEHPGSHLSLAVTTPPSELKPGSKSANRRKSFCARMGGMPGPMKDEKGRPTRKALSLRKWNC